MRCDEARGDIEQGGRYAGDDEARRLVVGPEVVALECGGESGGLLVVEVALMVKYIRGGVAAAMPELAEKHDSDSGGDTPDRSDDVLAFAY